VKSPYVDHIYSPETFAKTFSSLFPHPLSKLDLLIIMTYLSRDKKEVVCSSMVHPLESLTQAIKFRPSPTAALSPITISDTAIAQLKTVQSSLSEQIDLLTTQSETYTQKARDATKRNNRIVALSALKSRKLTESALQKRVDALARIEEVLGGVEQAASDVEIIKCLEGGASALERLNKEIGGIDRVEKVMDRVREGVEQSEDFGRVIAEMGQGRIDDVEVQDEFDEMLKAEQEKAKLQDQLEKQKEQEQQALLEKEKERVEAEKKQDVLVENLKSVSLEPPKEEVKGTATESTEEPIPS
jgi:charged multivesicular body protein 7